MPAALPLRVVAAMRYVAIAPWCAWALCAAACSVGDVEIVGRRCPCPSGYDCDRATQTCVRGPITEAGFEGASDDGHGDVSDGPSVSDRADALVCRTDLVECDNECVDVREDKRHCGGCGFACAGTCQAGRCIVSSVASLGCHDFAITEDGRHAFAASYAGAGAYAADGGLWRVDLESGAADHFVGPIDCAHSVLLVDDWVYWSTDGSWPEGTQDCRTPGVWRTPRAGGDTERVETEGLAGASALARSGEYVYWADKIAPGIFRAPIAGGVGEKVWGSPLMGCPISLAIHGDWIYYTDWAGETHSVLRLPLSRMDPPPEPEVIRDLAKPWGLLVFERKDTVGAERTHVFVTFLEGAGYAVEDGSWSWTPVGAEGGYREADVGLEGAGVVLSNDTLYWAMRVLPTARAGKIFRYRFTEQGLGKALVDQQVDPVGVARHGSYLYWCSLGEGLSRMPVSD